MTCRSRGSPYLDSDWTSKEPIGMSFITRRNPRSSGPPLNVRVKCVSKVHELKLRSQNGNSRAKDCYATDNLEHKRLSAKCAPGSVRSCDKYTSEASFCPEAVTSTGVSTLCRRYGRNIIAFSIKKVESLSTKKMKSAREVVVSRSIVKIPCTC